MWYWLSFSGDEGNLGICIVKADDEKTAHAQASQLGINPGGEVLIQPMPGIEPHEHLRYRLIPRDEAKIVGQYSLEELGRIIDPAVFKGDPPPHSIVCDDCN